MTTTTTRPGIRAALCRGIYVLPAKPAEPVRPVTGCGACDHGCDCEKGTPGCEHFGCWGTRVDDLADTCPAATALREHYLASVAYRRDLHAYNQSSHRR